MQQYKTSLQLFWWEMRREKKLPKLQLKQLLCNWINALISGFTTSNCHFCNNVATLQVSSTMQRSVSDFCLPTLDHFSACQRTCQQEHLKAKQTIMLCKASNEIPSNTILLTAELLLIALTFAQPGPLILPDSFPNKPMVIVSSRLR